ncbi:MAG: MarR family transcriptional regulator [Lachnospiraceae bacterium]|nr:MarR family transcriptional regulator [Lachnospiraceae bacterium]
MIPPDLWENQNAIKTLYAKCIGDVCVRHGITRMELDILLFLANNPGYDTATDIVELRYLAKSQVSVSIKLLEARGYLRKEYVKGNKKTAHLLVCDKAQDVLEDGRAAQKHFFEILFQDFAPEDIAQMKRYTERVRHNIDCWMKEELSDV